MEKIKLVKLHKWYDKKIQDVTKATDKCSEEKKKTGFGCPQSASGAEPFCGKIFPSQTIFGSRPFSCKFEQQFQVNIYRKLFFLFEKKPGFGSSNTFGAPPSEPTISRNETFLSTTQANSSSRLFGCKFEQEFQLFSLK